MHNGCYFNKHANIKGSFFMLKVGTRVARNKDSRKRGLMSATMAIIHETGLAEPTLSAICNRAGLSSSSIVSHYFKNRQELLEETMRDLANGFLGEVTMRVISAKTPMDKVDAIIDANFAPSQCTEEAISVWLWFWARVPTNKAFSAIEHSLETYIVNELKDSLKQLVPINEVERLAEGVMAITYGLWLRFALDQKKISIELAKEITKDLVHTKIHAYSA